jgi:hypothetical protein
MLRLRDIKNCYYNRAEIFIYYFSTNYQTFIVKYSLNNFKINLVHLRVRHGEYSEKSLKSLVV